ncbi:MAG TPA: RDD family protein [Thermoplasmata archaeon]|nr:RDD family protein [Thermoplasmata archaeon]
MSTPGTPLPSPPPSSFVPPSGPSPAHQYRYSGLAARFGAVVIDLLVLVVIALVAAVPLGIFTGVTRWTTGTLGPLLALAWVEFAIMTVVLWILYFSYFEGTSGATPGKRVFNLRVVSVATGQPPDLAMALVRTLLRIIDWLPFLYLLGFIVAELTSRKQRIGDLVANTIVIRT